MDVVKPEDRANCTVTFFELLLETIDNQLRVYAVAGIVIMVLVVHPMEVLPRDFNCKSMVAFVFPKGNR